MAFIFLLHESPKITAHISPREIVIDSDNKKTYCSFLGILLIAHRNVTNINIINESDGNF